MASLKEIVTKAVIGKTKKTSKDTFEIPVDYDISNVLGCWVINHNFSGVDDNGKAKIKGSYDVNVWYSYDDNTKTNVIVKTFSYDDIINVNLKSKDVLTDSREIIVRSLTAPQVSDVKVDGKLIKVTVEKEIGVEIVGDVKMRINAEEDFDDYEEEDNVKDLEMNITDDYLNGVNQK